MLSFNGGININAYINNDRSIVIDGKLGWDIFIPYINLQNTQLLN